MFFYIKLNTQSKCEYYLGESEYSVILLDVISIVMLFPNEYKKCVLLIQYLLMLIITNHRKLGYAIGKFK